jgi:NAD(P)-dependent dehydrogenase (short-subunit alcohol dehydrogenase family)
MGKGHRDKIAVITGGGAGLGQAFAHRLAQDGAHIVVADVQKADETVAMVEQAGARRSPVSATSRLRIRSPR